MSRKIDVLIAEHVMDGKVDYELKMSGRVPSWVKYHDLPGVRQLPHYSTDIAAAWEILDKICNTSKASFSLDRMWGKNHYSCGFYKGDNFEHAICFAAGTGPMAICLAALKAKGIEIPEDGDETS